MAATISQTMDFYLLAKSDGFVAPMNQAGNAAETTRQKLERLARDAPSFGERVRASMQLKRAEGATAIDRLFSGKGEGALDYLINAGPKVAITAFAMRMVGDAAESAAEHIKKMKDGSEGVAEGLLNIAGAVPIFGEAVRAGQGLGKLYLSMFADDPIELLKKAKERDEELVKRRELMEEDIRRHRLARIEGDAKAEQEIKDKYAKLDADNEVRRQKERKSDSEKAAEDAKKAFDIKWEKMVKGTGPGPGVTRPEFVAAARSAAVLVADARAHERDAQNARDKKIELDRLAREQREQVLDFVGSGEAVRRNLRIRQLEDSGQEYLAKAVKLEGEAQNAITEVAKRGAEARRQHPEFSREINKATVDEERALWQQLQYDLRRAQKETSDARVERIRQEQEQINDIRLRGQVAELRMMRQDLPANRAQIMGDLQKQFDELNARTTKDLAGKSPEEARRISQSSWQQVLGMVGLARLGLIDAQAKEQQRLSGADNQRATIQSQLARERIEALKEEGERGNEGASIEARKAEIAEKYIQKRRELLQILRDENATNDEKRQAIAAGRGLVDRQAAEMKQLLNVGGAAPTGFSLETGRFLSGYQPTGASPIDETAKNTAPLPDLLQSILTSLGDIGKAILSGNTLNGYDGN